jgi:hypothetical protein
MLEAECTLVETDRRRKLKCCVERLPQTSGQLELSSQRPSEVERLTSSSTAATHALYRPSPLFTRSLPSTRPRTPSPARHCFARIVVAPCLLSAVTANDLALTRGNHQKQHARRGIAQQILAQWHAALALVPARSLLLTPALPCRACEVRPSRPPLFCVQRRSRLSSFGTTHVYGGIKTH